MQGSDLVLVIVVATALAFDFTNGFHDTANAIATVDLDARDAAARRRSRLARAAELRRRVPLAQGRRDDRPRASSSADVITPPIVFAGLIGAIAWNLVTWYFGLPSSSSHALIGGRRRRGASRPSGAERGRRRRACVEKVIVPALVAPVLAFAWPGIAILIAYRIVGRLRPGPREPRLPRRAGRLRRAAGARARHQRRAEDDGDHHARAGRQRQHLRDDFHVPTWVVVCAATAIALGTYAGGWRIIRTMGTRIIKMDPAQGFAAQGAGRGGDPRRLALRLPAVDDPRRSPAAIMGAGAAKRAVGGALGRRREHRRRLGAHAARGRGRRRAHVSASAPLRHGRRCGPLVVSIVLLALLAGAFIRRAQLQAAAERQAAEPSLGLAAET